MPNNTFYISENCMNRTPKMGSRLKHNCYSFIFKSANYTLLKRKYSNSNLIRPLGLIGDKSLYSLKDTLII